jgi:hypothetical protein
MVSCMEVIERHMYESWEELIVKGMEARSLKDDSQWILGDLSEIVQKNYGEDSIGKYAYGVGVERKTLMNYRTISKRFPIHIREKYKKLSWSHFSAVSAEKIQKPEAWLEKADTEELSVESLRKQIVEAYPSVGTPKLDDEVPEVYRCNECGRWRLKDISSLEVCRGHYEIEKGEYTYR